MDCITLLGKKGFIGEFTFYLRVLIILESQNPIQHCKFPQIYFKTNLGLKMNILKSQENLNVAIKDKIKLQRPDSLAHSNCFGILWRFKSVINWT